MLWTLPGVFALVLGQTHAATARLAVQLPESVAAILDWGIILLFGGGLAMGGLADSTGLADAFGRWVVGHVPGAGTVGLTLVCTAVAILMSEAASNTAAATVVVPTAIAVATAAGVSPLVVGVLSFGWVVRYARPVSVTRRRWL